jgi:O-antigen/teichoic acid export membrane protein
MESGRKGRLWAGHLIQNAVSLMLSSGGSALLGVVFWAIAARLTTAKEVGLASAEIAAMVLLAGLSQLSFTTIFDRFLPVSGDRTFRFVTRAYGLCTLVALVASVAYVAAGIGHKYIPPAFGYRTLFVVAVVLWTIFVLQDSVLTGLRATRWVPVENILFSAAKIALLPLFLAVSAHQGLFLAWTVPVVVALGAVNWYLFRKRIPMHRLSNPTSENFPTGRELASLALGQYATALVSTFMGPIVALIVIQRLGPAAEAYYYLPALITSGGVGILLWNLVTSFLVEASTEPDELRQHTKVTIRAAAVVLIPTISIGVAFAPQILGIFGPEYAAHGTTLLRLLLLSLPGIAISAFYYSLAWLDRRVWLLAARELAGGAIYFILLFAFIGHYGILATGIASLGLSMILIILFLPISIRRYRMMVSSDNDHTGDETPVVAGTESQPPDSVPGPEPTYPGSGNGT